MWGFRKAGAKYGDCLIGIPGLLHLQSICTERDSLAQGKEEAIISAIRRVRYHGFDTGI
jgi:hypothetical protein